MKIHALSKIFLLFLSTLPLQGQEEPELYFLLGDSIPAYLQLERDSMGIPESWGTRIKAPVCEKNKLCYLLEMVLYWDLDGTYAGYDTLAGKALTKLDHKIFQEEDYRQLDDILRNPDSPLAFYTQEELTREQRKSQVDGFTGATITEVKMSSIEGAVYTCHTLWHIVYGPAKDSIRLASVSLFSPSLIKKLFARRDASMHIYLISHFSDGDFKLYLPMVLESLGEGEGYYSKQAIEAIPSHVLGDPRAQEYFVTAFSSMDYFTRVALLERMSPYALSPELRKVLAQHLTGLNTYENQLIDRLLEME